MPGLHPSANTFQDINSSSPYSSQNTTRASLPSTYNNNNNRGEPKAIFVCLSQLDLRKGDEWACPPGHQSIPSPFASFSASSIPTDPTSLNLSVAENHESVNSSNTEVSVSPVSLESGSRRRRGRPLEPPLVDPKQAKKRAQNTQHSAAYRARLMKIKSEHGLQQGEIESLRSELENQRSKLSSLQSENDTLRRILRDRNIPFPGSITHSTVPE